MIRSIICVGSDPLIDAKPLDAGQEHPVGVARCQIQRLLDSGLAKMGSSRTKSEWCVGSQPLHCSRRISPRAMRGDAVPQSGLIGRIVASTSSDSGALDNSRTEAWTICCTHRFVFR